jgi:cytochrome c6
MRRLVLAVAALSLAAVARADAAADIYAKRCASCHGKDGKGTSVGQKMGAKDISELKASEGEIVATISNGKGKMTAYKGKLSDEEIKSVAEYVKNGLK